MFRAFLVLVVLVFPRLAAAQLPEGIDLAVLGLGPVSVISIDSNASGAVTKAVLYGSGSFFLVNPNKPGLTSIGDNTLTRSAVVGAPFCVEAEHVLLTSPAILPLVQPFTKNGKQAWLVLDTDTSDGHQPFRELDLNLRLCR